MHKKYRKTREKIARPTYSFRKPLQNAHPASWRKNGSTLFQPTSKHSVETECRPSFLAEIMLILGLLIILEFSRKHPQPRLFRSCKLMTNSTVTIGFPACIIPIEYRAMRSYTVQYYWASKTYNHNWLTRYVHVSVDPQVHTSLRVQVIRIYMYI